jgi:hypothetical protein
MDNSTQFNPAAGTLIPAVVAADVETHVTEAKPETAQSTTPVAPPTELGSVDDGLRDFQNMDDKELIEKVQHVAKKYKTFNEYFRIYAPAIKTLHKKYAKKGQRLPIEGKPTWDKFVKDNFDITARHLRNLLNPPKIAEKETPEPLVPGDVETLFERRMKKKPFATVMDQVLGSLEPERFAPTLERWARLIAGHYSQQVEIVIATISDGVVDADTGPGATRPVSEHESACV